MAVEGRVVGDQLGTDLLARSDELGEVGSERGVTGLPGRQVHRTVPSDGTEKVGQQAIAIVVDR
jgi:hypothetical protein